MECTISWLAASGMGFVAETGSGHVLGWMVRPTAAAATWRRGPWRRCSPAPAAARRMTWC